MKVAQFEESLALFMGVSESVCFNSGYSALLVALRALPIGAGDEVLVPALCEDFVATAILDAGATPVFCDVEEAHLLLNIKDAQQRITDKTKAIVYAHFTGRLSNIRKLYWLAENYNLRIIEECSHAFGSRWNGQLSGSFGDINVYDRADKSLSTQGGFIVGSDAVLLQRLRETRGDLVMSESSADLGASQLSLFASELAPQRVSIAARYAEALRVAPGVSLIGHSYDGLVPCCYPLRFASPRPSPFSWKTLHRERWGALPVAERLLNSLLLLPVSPSLTPDEQDKIIASLF